MNTFEIAQTKFELWLTGYSSSKFIDILSKKLPLNFINKKICIYGMINVGVINKIINMYPSCLFDIIDKNYIINAVKILNTNNNINIHNTYSFDFKDRLHMFDLIVYMIPYSVKSKDQTVPNYVLKALKNNGTCIVIDADMLISKAYLDKEWSGHMYRPYHKSNSTFKNLEINPGSTLIWHDNPTITCKTIDNTNIVEYNNEKMTVSKFVIIIAKKIKKELGRFNSIPDKGWSSFRFLRKVGSSKNLNELRIEKNLVKIYTTTS